MTGIHPQFPVEREGHRRLVSRDQKDTPDARRTQAVQDLPAAGTHPMADADDSEQAAIQRHVYRGLPLFCTRMIPSAVPSLSSSR